MISSAASVSIPSSTPCRLATSMVVRSSTGDSTSEEASENRTVQPFMRLAGGILGAPRRSSIHPGEEEAATDRGGSSASLPEVVETDFGLLQHFHWHSKTTAFVEAEHQPRVRFSFFPLPAALPSGSSSSPLASAQPACDEDDVEIEETPTKAVVGTPTGMQSPSVLHPAEQSEASERRPLSPPSVDRLESALEVWKKWCVEGKNPVKRLQFAPLGKQATQRQHSSDGVPCVARLIACVELLIAKVDAISKELDYEDTNGKKMKAKNQKKSQLKDDIHNLRHVLQMMLMDTHSSSLVPFARHFMLHIDPSLVVGSVSSSLETAESSRREDQNRHKLRGWLHDAIDQGLANRALELNVGDVSSLLQLMCWCQKDDYSHSSTTLPFPAFITTVLTPSFLHVVVLGDGRAGPSLTTSTNPQESLNNWPECIQQLEHLTTMLRSATDLFSGAAGSDSVTELIRQLNFTIIQAERFLQATGEASNIGRQHMFEELQTAKRNLRDVVSTVMLVYPTLDRRMTDIITDLVEEGLPALRERGESKQDKFFHFVPSIDPAVKNRTKLMKRKKNQEGQNISNMMSSSIGSEKKKSKKTVKMPVTQALLMRSEPSTLEALLNERSENDAWTLHSKSMLTRLMCTNGTTTTTTTANIQIEKLLGGGATPPALKQAKQTSVQESTADKSSGTFKQKKRPKSKNKNTSPTEGVEALPPQPSSPVLSSSSRLALLFKHCARMIAFRPAPSTASANSPAKNLTANNKRYEKWEAKKKKKQAVQDEDEVMRRFLSCRHLWQDFSTLPPFTAKWLHVSIAKWLRSHPSLAKELFQVAAKASQETDKKMRNKGSQQRVSAALKSAVNLHPHFARIVARRLIVSADDITRVARQVLAPLVMQTVTDQELLLSLSAQQMKINKNNKKHSDNINSDAEPFGQRSELQQALEEELRRRLLCGEKARLQSFLAEAHRIDSTITMGADGYWTEHVHKIIGNAMRNAAVAAGEEQTSSDKHNQLKSVLLSPVLVLPSTSPSSSTIPTVAAASSDSFSSWHDSNVALQEMLGDSSEHGLMIVASTASSGATASASAGRHPVCYAGILELRQTQLEASSPGCVVASPTCNHPQQPAMRSVREERKHLMESTLRWRMLQLAEGTIPSNMNLPPVASASASASAGTDLQLACGTVTSTEGPVVPVEDAKHRQSHREEYSLLTAVETISRQVQFTVQKEQADHSSTLALAAFADGEVGALKPNTKKALHIMLSSNEDEEDVDEEEMDALRSSLLNSMI